MNNQIELLRNLSKEKPKSVIARLNSGQEIDKSMGLKYLIDNPNIDLILGDFPQGAIPYGQIYRKLKSNSSDILRQFGGRNTIPFSEIFNADLGECLEKAVLVQLAAQRKEESFLINGTIEEDGEVGAGFHAYNIVARAGKLFLVDAQNPARVDSDGKIHPYIAPVTDICGAYGDFQVPSERKMGRTYSIN
jgi:hypothetical protein